MVATGAVLINRSVGHRGANFPDDVMKVQTLLNLVDKKNSLLPVGICGPDTIEAIRRFQKGFMRVPDGRVDPGKGTITRLNIAAADPGHGVRRISVSLKGQMLKAYRGSALVFDFVCTTGDADHPTPLGRYRIHRKHAKYMSRTYNVAMDHAMFFHKGYAIHEAVGVMFTAMLKRSGMQGIGSHGCVRLSVDSARILFRWAPMGTLVEILP